jgi:hypothetical protein
VQEHQVQLVSIGNSDWSCADRLFVFLMRMRGGQSSVDLEGCTHMSAATLSRDFHFILPIMVQRLNYEIQWPSEHERNELVGKIIDFPDAIGVVDATHTQIRRPSINQREYYRLDYACHTYAHQMIVDWKGKIIYLATGMPGSVHDRRIWTHSQPFTHKHNYFSDNQTLLADKGYEADGDWLITLHKRKRNENIWQRQTREARKQVYLKAQGHCGIHICLDQESLWFDQHQVLSFKKACKFCVLCGSITHK